MPNNIELGTKENKINVTGTPIGGEKKIGMSENFWYLLYSYAKSKV